MIFIRLTVKKISRSKSRQELAIYNTADRAVNRSNFLEIWPDPKLNPIFKFDPNFIDI